MSCMYSQALVKCCDPHRDAICILAKFELTQLREIFVSPSIISVSDIKAAQSGSLGDINVGEPGLPSVFPCVKSRVVLGGN